MFLENNTTGNVLSGLTLFAVWNSLARVKEYLVDSQMAGFHQSCLGLMFPRKETSRDLEAGSLCGYDPMEQEVRERGVKRGKEEKAR